MIVIFDNVMASEAYNCLFCHEGIYSACWLIVEFDCENDMASEAGNCLLCHEVIHSAYCLFDDRDF